MSIDKFGRYSHVFKSGNLRGPKGEGFILTAGGNFDIQSKKLRNVSEPTADNDAVNFRTLKGYVNDSLRIDGGNFNAKGKLITGIGDAVNENDAVTLKYLKKHAITTGKQNKLNANKLIISNVGTPLEDSDAVTVEFLKNHTLYLHKDIDAKMKRIKNVAKPKDPLDALNYTYFIEVLAALSYTIYLKLNENKKKKFTKVEWFTKVLSNLHDWNELFEAVDI